MAVDYAKDIKPLLKERCYACHGALKQKAGLRLDTELGVFEFTLANALGRRPSGAKRVPVAVDPQTVGGFVFCADGADLTTYTVESNAAAVPADTSEVWGLSRDSIKSHENFKAKLSLPFDLISDPDEIACAAFGVMKLKNMYGKQVRGIERSTFVIDAAGILRREWRGVKVPGHAQEVLDYIKAL